MSEADDDRDLDAFLARQSPVAGAWRDAVRETHAPDTLDAAILRAAADAPAATVPPQAQRARRRRWRLPIGLAASVLVGIGVLREVDRDPAARTVLSEPAVAAAPVAAAADVEAAADERAPSSVAPSVPESLKMEAAEARTMERERQRAMARQADDARRKKAAPQARAVPAPPPPPSPPPVAPAIERESPVLAGEAAATSSDAFAARAEMTVAEPRLPPPAALAAAPPPVADVAASAALVIGRTTLDEVRAQFGEPVGGTERAADGSTLLRYARQVDARGTMRLRFDATAQRLIEAQLRLDPPLPLDEVRRDQRLDAPAGAACERAADEPIEGPAAGTLRWPSLGVQLRLDDEGRVTEIVRRAGCG